MTISSTTRIAGPFLSGTALPFTFKVFSAADLRVVRLNTSTGVETTLVLSSDYTVALNGNQNTNPGGTVNLTVAASATSTVTITSDIANLQPTDLTNQGGFYPEVITDALDRATIQIQQMSEDVGRSLKGPISDGNLNMELPTAAQRANSFLAFDANGVPTAVVSGSSGAPTTITRQVFSGTGSQTVFTLASDPGALGNSAQVYIGGVYQQRSTYTIAGTTLTFSAAPVAGTDNIEFVNYLTSSIGSTSADLVTYTPSGVGAVAMSAQQKMRQIICVDDYGAVGNTTTGLDGNDDTVAVQAAMNAAVTANARGYVRFTPGKAYRITATLNVPSSITVDFSNALVYAPTVTTVFSLGAAANLMGYLGYLQSSGNAGAAIKRASQGTSNPNHILGQFSIVATNARVAGSIAVDVTGFYGSVVSANASNFEKAFANESSVPSATTYYNQFMNCRTIGCVYGFHFTGTATNIINGTDIHSFDFNGQGNGIYGMFFDSAGTITVVGGYIEGMEGANAAVRGVLVNSTLGAGSSTVSMYGLTLDSASTASNYAIEFGANTDGCVLHGVRFGGGWSSSSKTVLAAATAEFAMTGSGTATQFRIGKTGAGTAASDGEVLCNQVTCTKVVQSGSLAGDNAATFNNTADGDGIAITTASTTVTRPSVNCIRSAEGRVISTSVSGSAFAGIFVGNGSPETVYSAQPGSLYLRKDGSAGTCLYVKESGTGNTGWIAK
jgi:hypothetical protein